MKFTHSAESRPLDGYTIKRPLHRGGFGEVYFAVTDGGRDVALKLLKENVEVELRGVQQCLNLSHPNLVTIFDVKQDGDGDYWIVMEFVPGETLDDVLRRVNQPMPMQEVLRWMRGICAGVSHLHERGIVHRDLKPSNLFGAEGVIKVGDIGLSKYITASRRSAHTESVGTVYYMAPEISRGRYGNEVDIYAMGVIAYEMLTGKIPFDGESAGEILMKHLTSPPNLNPLPERLRPIIQRALSKDPHRRPASALEFLREFEAAVVGRTSTSPSASVGNSPSLDQKTTSFVDGERRPSTWSLPLIIGFVLLLVVAGRGLGPVEFPVIAIIMVGAGLVFYGTTRPQPSRDVGRDDDQWKRRLSGHQNAGSPMGQPATPHQHMVHHEINSQDVWLSDRDTPLAHPASNSPWYGHWLVLASIIGIGLYGMRSGLPLPMVVISAGLVLAMVAFITKTFQFGREVLFGPATSPARGNPLERVPPWPAWRSPLPPIRVPRERLIALVTTSFFAPLTTTALTASVGLVRPDILQMDRGIACSTIFLSIVTLGTWLIAFVSMLAEGQHWDGWTRRGMFGAAGLLTGGAGFAIWKSLFFPDGWLLNSAGQDALFAHFGSHSLVTSDHTPTLAGFLCFFGVFFALINWTKQTHRLRASRLGLWPMIVSVLAGGLTAQLLEFPLGMAVLSSGVISAAVQLTSPGNPPRRRVC